jgi:fibronectin type 3 domain-containing protein
MTKGSGILQKSAKIAKGIAALAAVALMVATARAANIAVEWDASPTAGVSYRLYWNTTAAPDRVQGIETGALTTGTITNAIAGLTYQIWAAAVDTNNVESEPANAITFTVPDTTPGAVILLSSKLAQTNRTWQVAVTWQPAPFQEAVTGYEMDVIQGGLFFTNLFTTNTSAAVAMPVVNPTLMVLKATNYYGWGKTNLVKRLEQPGTPRMELVWLK